MRPLILLPIGFGVLALLFVVLALDAFRRRRGVSGTVQVLVAVLFGALAIVGGLLAFGTTGYRALTLETVAATATVAEQPDGAFLVSMRLVDGTQNAYVLRGDELYVDAQILKWHPAANVVGLHTAYSLDRIAGRYRELSDERHRPRTVYQIAQTRPVDLFGIVQRYPFLSGLVDATYGSATFAPLRSAGTYEIRVSTSGLLVRSLE